MRITNKKITWIFIYKVEKSEANRSNTYVFLCGNPSTQLDGWMASLTRWTWVWVNSGSWWWTGRPGVLRFMGSQRVGHDWATELNWTELKHIHWASQVALVVKNPPANTGDLRTSGSIPGSVRSPGEGHANPLHILAWRIPWTEEPGGLQSIGSHRVRHDWTDLACTHTHTMYQALC